MRRATAPLLLGLLVAASIGVLPATAPSAQAATGLTTTADARYVVDPDAHRVHVAVALAATNHLVDTKTRRFFFDKAYLAVQPGTAAFKISSPGAAPRITVAANKGAYTLLRIDFGIQLAAGATRTFSIAYDIVDPGGAPTRPVRIGTSLVSFPAWGLGSDGATGGSVTVTFPFGFTIDVDAEGLGDPTTDAAGNTTYTTGRLVDPLGFSATFVADRPSAFTETRLDLTVRGQPVIITLRAWPDDPAWAKRVAGLMTTGLPALADLIGLPLPPERPLIVEEAVSRSAAGFAGRYDPSIAKIEIAYYADPFVVLHEAAHAWFDGSLLTDRWASEGFASWYAMRAAAATKTTVAGDPLTKELEAARIPLNAWLPSGQNEPLIEDAGYAASLELARLVAERAGPDALRAVWQDIRTGRAPYQPAGAEVAGETNAGPPDWRGLLDLIEAEAGTSFSDLWAQWVVRPEEAGLLQQRDEARSTYTTLEARAGAWRLPRILRDALRAWQFTQVQELATGANRALDDRDSVHQAATASGLTPPDTMQLAFEGPRGFAAASAEADVELAAIRAYDAAKAKRLASPDIVQAIGLWSATPDDSLAAAAQAFAAGDLERVVSEAAFAGATWDQATTIGRNRLITSIVLLAATLLGLWMVLRWFRQRRRRRRGRPPQAVFVRHS